MEAKEFTVLPGSPADLAEMIRREVRQAVREEVPEAVRLGTRQPYLTKKALQEWTGWSARKIEYMKSKRKITFIRRGRTVLFPTKEVIAYLEEGRVSKREGTR